MQLAPGTSLGPYEVLARIGVGGMGEVWKARDTRLGRTVAIKTSNAAFNERFEREARAIAALNHPNVCTLYDVGPDYLVMEHIDGLTLAERIEQGPLPLDEALSIARQIAEALESAHDKGIVHRDLKPANVKITPDGAVKVLDFGLATAFGNEPAAAAADANNSATMTMRATQAGMIMGTAGYMAPEQASGKPVDRRADIWSFGVVLSEMVTGKQLFCGETLSHTLADVLRAPIEFKEVPAGLRPLLSRCLDRDPKQRLQSIGEARIAIQNYKESVAPAATAAPVVAKPAKSWLPWAAAMLGAAATFAAMFFYPRHQDLDLIQFDVSAPPGSQSAAAPALSPDGKHLVFQVTRAGDTSLVLYTLATATSRPLTGTEGGVYPFWSPDGQRVAFVANGQLKSISTRSGDIQRIAGGVATEPGTWNSSGVILIASASRQLCQVPDSGGVLTPVLSFDSSRKESAHHLPFFLPDGKHFVFTSHAEQQPGLYWSSLDGGKPAFVMDDAIGAVYAPSILSASGYLIVERASQAQPVLFSVPFNAANGRVTGREQRLTSQSGVTPGSASGRGSIAFRPSAENIESRLTWQSRNGEVLGTAGEPADHVELRISPDGRRVATSRESGDIWIVDLERGGLVRLTSGTGNNSNPVWSPDGSEIIYASAEAGKYRLMRKSAGGAGPATTLLEQAIDCRPQSWSPDGRWLLYRSGVRSHWDVFLLPLFGDRKPVPLLVDVFDKYGAEFSPDGHWIAYSSPENGRREVYVIATPPGNAAKWTVSTQGGTHPRWRADGKELYFVSLDRQMMAAPVNATATSFRTGEPVRLFPFRLVTNPVRYFDPSPDGKRFLSLVQPETAPTGVRVILNWESLLKK